MSPRAEINQHVNKILEFSDPYIALQEKITVKNKREIVIAGNTFTTEKPLIISVGKASVKMAKFFIERLNSIRNIVIKPKGSPRITMDDAEIIESSHPIPDDNSIYAGNIILEALYRENYDMLLFLISGGSSSMLELSDIALDELKYLYKKLIESGISIHETNTVRKHLSKIKGGQLALLSKAPILTIAVSDVPGDDISSIGSGPTVPDPTTVDDAKRILNKLGLHDYLKYLRETPKHLSNSSYYIILNNIEVLKKLAKLHNNSFILTSEVSGDAISFGELIGSIYTSSEIYGIPFKKPYMLLAGGEPEVKLIGKVGKGGRNGEVALGFYKRIKRAKTKFQFLAIATDGIDGNSEYAGCIIDESIDISIDEIDNYLSRHASYELLEMHNAVVKTGYTFTNVNNIYLLLVE